MDLSYADKLLDGKTHCNTYHCLQKIWIPLIYRQPPYMAIPPSYIFFEPPTFDNMFLTISP